MIQLLLSLLAITIIVIGGSLLSMCPLCHTHSCLDKDECERIRRDKI